MAAEGVPAVTVAQMREIERLMVDELRLDPVMMMENAGRSLAALAARLLPRRGRVAVLTGPGRNGAGGLAATRHLLNWGLAAHGYLAGDPGRVSPEWQRQATVLRNLGAPVEFFHGRLAPCDLVVDAIIGHSLYGQPRGAVAQAIAAANAAGAPVLALDLPSGLEPDTGRPGAPCVRATITLAVALPKKGVLAMGAAPFVGRLYVADVGVPPGVVERVAGRPFRFPGAEPIAL